MILYQFVILIFSLILLVFFSDKLIDASAKLAKALGISDVVIGLTLLAYGTSLPEFSVAIISAIASHPQISVSNVIGSNIVNVALIIGMAALVRPFQAKLANRDNLIMILSTILLASLVYFSEEIHRISGAMMVFSIMGHTYYTLRHDRINNTTKKDATIPKLKESIIVVICLLVVVISGKLTVNSAVAVAKGLGVTEWMIGATIIAIGTSLPELAVSLSAARKGFFSMSIGNIVGSNIFNILWVLGFAAALGKISLSFSMIKWDIVFLIVVTFLFSFHLIKASISRIEGVVYLALYTAYIAYLLT